MLTNSEWTGIHELSLLIHGTRDMQAMERYFLEALQHLIPFERAAFFLFHEQRDGQISLHSPVFLHIDLEAVTTYGSLINTNSLCRRVISLRRTLAYRSSDLVTPDDAATDAMSILRRSFLLPNDVRFYSGIVLADEGKVLGEIILYRTAKQRDFTDNEVEILDRLKDHLAIRLHDEATKESSDSPTSAQEPPSYTALGLTPRESEIVSLVMQHYSTDDISRHLVISQYTTKKHLHHIFAKLGVRNRLQLIAAIRTWKRIQA